MASAKYVKDCIYKQIKIPTLCQAFIDTPEFQRLRFIKQLGHVHYVYPSAVHTRFEHSLGVMHLSGKMVKALRRQGAEISDRQRDLIQLAGLLHDVGHMAYSHLFDKFIETVKDSDVLPHHESRSLEFFWTINARLKLLTESEVEFVSNLIMGMIPNDVGNAYLYEIVCNKQCGVDVDKMDYLFRDAYHTGMHGFQSDYIIRNARLKDGHIAFSRKTEVDMKDLFDTRHRMHLNVYRHHTVRKYEKIYWCAMKRTVSQDGTLRASTDVTLENQLQKYIPELFERIWTRDLDHNCEYCVDYKLDEPVTESGNIDQVPFC
jgi:HD superfamily phosphohydrolase